jgi:hypothetical protein
MTSFLLPYVPLSVAGIDRVSDVDFSNSSFLDRVILSDMALDHRQSRCPCLLIYPRMYVRRLFLIFCGAIYKDVN